MPTNILKPRSEDPPELINGSGIPMTGMIPIVIPILTNTCINMTPTTP
jgi:hypothetical protein